MINSPCLNFCWIAMPRIGHFTPSGISCLERWPLSAQPWIPSLCGMRCHSNTPSLVSSQNTCSPKSLWLYNLIVMIAITALLAAQISSNAIKWHCPPCWTSPSRPQPWHPLCLWVSYPDSYTLWFSFSLIPVFPVSWTIVMLILTLTSKMLHP